MSKDYEYALTQAYAHFSLMLIQLDKAEENVRKADAAVAIARDKLQEAREQYIQAKKEKELHAAAQ